MLYKITITLYTWLENKKTELKNNKNDKLCKKYKYGLLISINRNDVMCVYINCHIKDIRFD